mmetsp:Transcript_12959/g.30407  ORF Transcript_12959/g.30407 Transcript_12959/m.30407 type:complete len:212 (-) Transcript_12959:1572-2207(-)
MLNALVQHEGRDAQGAELFARVILHLHEKIMLQHQLHERPVHLEVQAFAETQLNLVVCEALWLLRPELCLVQPPRVQVPPVVERCVIVRRPGCCSSGWRRLRRHFARPQIAGRPGGAHRCGMRGASWRSGVGCAVGPAFVELLDEDLNDLGQRGEGIGQRRFHETMELAFGLLAVVEWPVVVEDELGEGALLEGLGAARQETLAEAAFTER